MQGCLNKTYHILCCVKNKVLNIKLFNLNQYGGQRLHHVPDSLHHSHFTTLWHGSWLELINKQHYYEKAQIHVHIYGCTGNSSRFLFQE